jgi:hypothetical protein
MDRPVLYLDTNHVSALARYPDQGAAPQFLSALRGHHCYLGLSFIHLFELSNPRFVDRPAVGRMLDAVPLAWAVHQSDLFDQEITAALSRVLTGTDAKAHPFYRDPVQAWGMPSDAHVSCSEMLDALAGRPDLGDDIRHFARRAAELDKRLKTQAAAVQRPIEPLAASIKAANIRRTPAGLHLTAPLDPETVILRAGGLKAFPAYEVFQDLGVTRYGDPHFSTDVNDVLDDLHAVYAPYSEIMLLDRATSGRYRSARLPRQDRVFFRLEDAAPFLPALCV